VTAAAPSISPIAFSIAFLQWPQLIFGTWNVVMGTSFVQVWGFRCWKVKGVLFAAKVAVCLLTFR
jgi:hypothetical protein